MQTKLVSVVMTILLLSKPDMLLAQTFYSTKDSNSDSYTGSSNSYEIRRVSYMRSGDRIRFVIDSDVPLSGHRESGAFDGHVGYTDIRITTPTTTYGVKFAPNENAVPNGLYKNVRTSSIVQQNFGRDGAGLPTLVQGGELVTSDIKVYEYTEATDSHRIVVEMPANQLELIEGGHMYVTLECGNDVVELTIPPTDFPELEINIPDFPPIAPTYPDILDNPKDDSAIGIWKIGIPIGILLIILILLNPPTESNPKGEPPIIPPVGQPPVGQPPIDKPPVKVPEGDVVLPLIMLLLCGGFIKKKY